MALIILVMHATGYKNLTLLKNIHEREVGEQKYI